MKMKNLRKFNVYFKNTDEDLDITLWTVLI